MTLLEYVATSYKIYCKKNVINLKLVNREKVGNSIALRIVAGSIEWVDNNRIVARCK